MVQLLLFSSKMFCLVIEYEKDYSKHTVKMEINQEKNSEDLWHSKISLNGKWQSEGKLVGKDTPPPMPFIFRNMGP